MNETVHFITGQELSVSIDAQTGGFERRDFVAPLLSFCLDANYAARLGIVYGLRATGKTVGMLQAAGALLQDGYKAAYARFNYREAGMRDVNAAIVRLAEEGYTHFFIDEAPYVSGFLHESAEWADSFVPERRVKIVISGTDSFELWLAMNRALYHRYVSFSTNRNNYPEYKRVRGGTFDEYKTSGGVFLTSGEHAMAELAPGAGAPNAMAVENFLDSAVADNLIHTLEHCAEYASSNNYYTDWLYAIDKQVIFKGIISILKSTAEAFIRKKFIQEAGKQNLPDLGAAISKWPDPEKDDIKARIAASIGIYQNSVKISDPAASIDALLAFLVKIGCLLESATGVSDLTNQQRTLYFAHNALMNYAVDETKRGILSMEGIDRYAFSKSLEQAAEGSLHENIVYTHLLLSANPNEAVFRYRDPEAREIDAVLIDREAKTLRLFEVKSKQTIDIKRVFQNEAKSLFDDAVLKNIGVDGSFSITRAVVYRGNTGFVRHQEDVLLLANMEELLLHYRDLGRYLDGLTAGANEKQSALPQTTLAEELREGTEKANHQFAPPQKGKGGHEIGD
jgi:predicted AAA+ superfamily ATPase